MASTVGVVCLNAVIERGKGEGGGRGRVPGGTGRRSRCCGFAEVLGFSRAEL